MKKHRYSAQITWKGNTGTGTSNYRAYERNFTVTVDGKKEIEGSSDPAFLGDQTRHNPEELFLASISSCHMLWYLHLCSEHKITVVDYRDEASGVMIEEKGGAGYFRSVTLKPYIVILESDKKGMALKLHEKANRMCFIANSCKVEIKHQPVIDVQ